MGPSVETSGFVGRVLGDRWVVGEQLGSGSFGVVHRGVERATGAAVAVKLLHPQFLHHHETIGRFWNEAEALRRLDHPNVLTLLDVGMADDGVPYLVTELLTGETLRDLLNREGALPPDRAMRLLGPVAHALHHAHLAGIVHRDLKPENIFRMRKDGMGTTKILDFGVAKLLDTASGKKLSQTGVMIGTMAYSPPEQMQGVSDVDHRADQFGFAALMFEALTGQRPFPHQQPFALFQAVVSGPRPRASDLRPELPRAIDGVFLRALDPDRERRFASVEEFYLALTEAFTDRGRHGLGTFSEGHPAAPSRAPPGLPFRDSTSKPSKRHRPIDEDPTRRPGVPSAPPPDAHGTLASVVSPFASPLASEQTRRPADSARPPPQTESATGTTLPSGRGPGETAATGRLSEVARPLSQPPPPPPSPPLPAAYVREQLPTSRWIPTSLPGLIVAIVALVAIGAVIAWRVLVK